MADNTILLKRNTTNTTVPTTSDIVVGKQSSDETLNLIKKT